MNFQLKYVLGVEEQLAHEEFKSGKNLSSRPNYFRQIAPMLALSGLGLVASFKAQSVFLLIAFLSVAFSLVVRALAMSHGWNRKLKAAIKEAPKIQVELVIDDTGLHEIVEAQLRSFSPWSAVKSYIQYKQVWVFNLVGGYTALVAASAIAEAGPSAVADLKSALKARSIPQLVRE